MPRRTHRKSGYTMVELVVSMAILLTVLSGIALLYTGAVRTVRQGYSAIDNTEIGRSVLAALERDLEHAFTARQYGQYYTFHGQPNAFMYVGMLSSDQLGRVTYAINRLDNANDFVMQDTQPLRMIIERAMAQKHAQYADPSRTWEDRMFLARDFTRELIQVLIEDGFIITAPVAVADEDDFPQLLDEAFLNAFNRYINVPGPTDPSGYISIPKLGPLVTSNGAYNFDSATVACEVYVRTAYLLRYEEPGVTDLSSFVMPVDPNLLDEDNDDVLDRMRFPSIDPAEIDGALNNPDFATLEVNCGGLALGGSENLGTVGQARLTCETYGSIVMPITGGLLQGDFRELLISNPSTGPAAYVTPRTITQIFDAGKRDIWLEFFQGTPRAQRFFTSDANVLIGQNYFAMDKITPGDPGKNPLDYAVAERIVVSGSPVSAARANHSQTFNQEFENFDFLGVGPFFTYSNLDGPYQSEFNALTNIPYYNEIMTAAPVFDDNGEDARFALFDAALGEEMTTVQQGKSQGSPIAPRIPALVSPRFWIMSEGPTANDPPFKRYFDQVVEVPSSTRRTLPAQFVPDAG